MPSSSTPSDPPPQRRAERQAETRERLLDAAREAFAAHGYGGASVGTIAEAAGYTKGAFYSNFESKEALFIALLRRHKRQEVEALRTLIGADGDVDEMLDALAAQLNAAADGDETWALLSFELQRRARSSPAVAEALAELQAQQQSRLAELIATLFDQAHKAPPVPPRDLAAAGMALAYGLTVLQAPWAGDDGASSNGPPGTLLTLFLRSVIDAAPSA